MCMLLQDNFINYFSFGFQFANISMLYIANKYQSNFSMESRILYPMIIQFLIYVGITAMVKLDVTGDTFFYVTLVLVMVSAGCTAFYQGGLFGFSAMLPPKCVMPRKVPLFRIALSWHFHPCRPPPYTHECYLPPCKMHLRTCGALDLRLWWAHAECMVGGGRAR